MLFYLLFRLSREPVIIYAYQAINFRLYPNKRKTNKRLVYPNGIRFIDNYNVNPVVYNNFEILHFWSILMIFN